MKFKYFPFFQAFTAPYTLLFVIIQGASAQSPTPIPIDPNGITMIANGIVFTITPGSPPRLSAVTTDGAPATISKTLRFVDKHGRNVDPHTITSSTRFQAIYDSTANGLVIQQVMVDRD